MGSEAEASVFAPSFNRAIRVIGHDDRSTANAGMLLLREVNHRLGITAMLTERLYDPRDPSLRRYELAELIDQSLYGIGSGYAHQDDQDFLAHDPALRAAAWHRPGDRVTEERLSSQPTQSRALTTLTAQRPVLEAALPEVLMRHRLVRGEKHRPRRGTVDIDTFPVTVYGRQEDAAYSGYYRRTVYQALAASFAPCGDYDQVRPANGFIHARLGGTPPTAKAALSFIREAARRAAPLAHHVDVRFDAAYAVGAVMDGLEDDDIRFVGRLRNSAALDALAQPHLTRPAGRPPAEGSERAVEMGRYTATGGRHSFRLVLMIVDLPDPVTGCLQLFPHYFFLVTNWSAQALPVEEFLPHYRNRGTFEDRFSELVGALDLHLSCSAFDRNETTLFLRLLAFNLVNVVRAEMERVTGSGWDLRRIQHTVLKAAARVVYGGRQILFYLAAASAAVWKILLAVLAGWKTAAPEPPQPRAYVPAPAHAHLTMVYRL